MVHALIKLHRALTARGILIDLRPDRTAAPRERVFHPQLYCVEDGRKVHAGRLKTLKPLADYRAADRALRRVTRRRLFVSQATEAFDFRYYFDSPAHLEKAVATCWADTVLEASTLRRLNVVLRKFPAAQIMAVSRIRLNVLRRR